LFRRGEVIIADTPSALIPGPSPGFGREIREFGLDIVRALKLALQGAQRADQLEHEKYNDVADTLATVYFSNGNVVKALETQERAVRLAKRTTTTRE
jgi:hypothetical protein